MGSDGGGFARRQFPQESEKELAFLEESFKEVRKRKALAEWELAQYYDERGEYRAARHHYDRVAKDTDRCVHQPPELTAPAKRDQIRSVAKETRDG